MDALPARGCAPPSGNSLVVLLAGRDGVVRLVVRGIRRVVVPACISVPAVVTVGPGQRVLEAGAQVVDGPRQDDVVVSAEEEA